MAPSSRRILRAMLAVVLVLSLARAAAPQSPAETVLLDDSFRVDIRTISVTFDYYPDRQVVDAAARVQFVMRAGQSIPRFHFTPAERNASAVRSMAIDGVPVAFPGPAVAFVRVSGSSQSIAQVDRPLSQGQLHTLDVAYRLDLPSAYPRFSTEVNDMAGRGNEQLFPTINSPRELARHRLALRVHGPREFRCIGSGLVERADDGEADVQQWILDTEREVSSYTVMFALLPAADSDLQERVIHGIPVRVMAFRNGASIPAAFATLEDWLPELDAAFGLYPAPRGLSVFLVSQGGGMEYFGATISSPGALTHEVTHGYFACAVVLATYRDSWLDEAIAQWFTDVSHGTAYAAMPGSYRGNWVGARSPASVGYSNLAYSDGSRIMQYLADRLGGTARMTQFLRYLYERYAFRPFTTVDFLGYFRDFSGIDVQAPFEQWLYGGSAQGSGAAVTAAGWGPALPRPTAAGLRESGKDR